MHNVHTYTLYMSNIATTHYIIHIKCGLHQQEKAKVFGFDMGFVCAQMQVFVSANKIFKVLLYVMISILHYQV